ncbi:MAG TPA: TonB-dependent receptor [Rhizomicrobium sp.]|nr:TonB-dependent receptor [Rhizomicrobium sp.]
MFRSILLSTTATAILLSTSTAGWSQAHAPGVESIVVTATPLASANLATIPAHVDADQILHQGGASLADALSNIPGVSSTGFAAGASRPIIRGMDANRVRILENGTSSSDASDIGPDHGVPIDPISTRSIEVVRGAGTLRYGSQAIGGVINAINNRIPLTLPDKPSGEAQAAYDSVSDAGQGAVLGDLAIGNYAFHVDGFYRHTDDYDTPLGPQANSFFRGDGFSLGSSYFFGDGNASRIGAALIHYDAKYGVPSDVTFINMRQTKLLTGSSLNLGDGLLRTLNINGSYGNYSHEEIDPTNNNEIAATFKNKEFDGRAEALLGAVGLLTNSAVGIEIQNRQFSALGDAANYLLPTLTQNYAGFLFTEMPLGQKLHLQASGRAEVVQIAGTPNTGIHTTRGFAPLSAAIGGLFDLTDEVKLGLTGSSTARAPAQTELFARGPHDGPQAFETGDPTLKMERANSLEGTVRLRLPEFTFDGSIYTTSFDNYVYGALTGRNCDDAGNCALGSPGALRELNYLQQSASFRGLEAKAVYDLWHVEGGVLQVTALADYVRATLSGGVNVPRIPPWRAGGGLEWQSEAFDAGFQVIRVGAQNNPGQFDTSTQGYVSVDAQLSWRPFPENSKIEIALIARNLANEVVRNAASLNKDLVVMPGRNIRLALRYATDE